MNQIHSSSLLCQLSQMWRDEVLCDAYIWAGKDSIKVLTTAYSVCMYHDFSSVMVKPNFFPMQKTKAQISCAVNNVISCRKY